MPPKPRKNPSDDDAKPSIGEQVLQSLTAQDFGKLAQQRFENALVEKILLRYPCGADMKEHLRHQCRTPAGSWMTFDAFWNSYSNRFPVYLFVRRFNKIVADTPLHRLADRFTSCRVTKYLLDAAEDAPASQPGLAFHWPFMKNKHSVTRAGAAMVLHQLDLPEFDDVPGLEVRFRDRDRLWRIAPLGFFLEGLSLAGVFRI